MAAKELRARSQRCDVKTRSETSGTSDNRSRYADVFLRVGFSALATTTILIAPEGSIRNGDYLPTVLLLTLFCLLLAICRLVFNRQGKEGEETKKKGRRPPLRICDWALVLFILLATASYMRVVVTKCGDVRFSTNAYWTFVAPTAFYFILRNASSLLSPRALRAIFTLIVACSVAESAYSLYAYAVVNPAIRAQYRANPEQTLKDAGIYFPNDSQERALFEKRLLESSEPTGAYGLANTLAGVLAPSLIIALLGIPWFAPFKRSNVAKTRLLSCKIAGALWCVGVLLITFILITTKSRSGVLASFSCLLLYGLYQGLAAFQRKTAPIKTLKFAAIFFGVLALILTGSVFSGIVDKEVFTEAGKSLGYRLDYWRATAAMIRDYPILGIGPGEFQSVYARYILPTASEFIADPHNFAFEIAALFGAPALFAFALFLLGVFAGIARLVVKNVNELDVSSLPANENASNLEDKSFRDVVAGFFLGLVVVFLTSFLHSTPVQPSFYIITLAPALIVFATSRRLLPVDDSQRFTPLVAGLAALAVLINLLAAGGIGYPCVSVLIFILSAVVVNESKIAAHEDKDATKRSVLVPLGLVVGLGFLVAIFYTTAFKPRNLFFLFNLNASDGLATFATPKEVDAYSIEVARIFYGRAALEYFKTPTENNRKAWQEAREHVKKTSPNSAPLRESCGDLDWSFYQQSPQEDEFGASALDFYRESVERSPTDVSKRAKLARAFAALGNREEAVQEAKRALEGDALTPHLDRKLNDADRNFLTELVESSDRR